MRLKAIFFAFYVWLRNHFWLQVVWGIAVAVGPLAIGWARLAPKPEDVANGKPGWYLAKESANFFDANPKVALICYCIPAVAVIAKFGFQWLDKKAKYFKDIKDDGLLMLLEVFLGIVGQKMERIGCELEKLAIDGKDLDRINAIVFGNGVESPQRAQVENLMEGIYKAFGWMTDTNKSKLKVALALAGPKSFQSWVYFLPRDDGPAILETTLKKPHSGISRAIEGKTELLIVESVSKEKNRDLKKARFAADNEKEGSLVCYPVYQRNLKRVVFVISVYADKNDVFRENERSKYNFVLRQFSKRLLVEYNLLVLSQLQQEAANCEKNSPLRSQDSRKTS